MCNCREKDAYVLRDETQVDCEYENLASTRRDGDQARITIQGNCVKAERKTI